MTWAVAFGLVAALFVFVSGANDGATLLGLGLRYPRTPGLVAMAVLLCALVLVPLGFGLAVASTFTEGLADFGSPSGALAFLLGVGVSLVVVGVLAWRGLPTSLTLALIGGVTGAGLGAGLAVSWDQVGRVLLIGVAAPFVGGGIAYLLGLVSRRIPTTGGVRRGQDVAHWIAFTGQCAAYAANDGQKMFAVVSVAVDVAILRGVGEVRPVEMTVGLLVLTALVFGLGALISLQRVGERLGRGLVLARPLYVVSTETAAASSVFGSALLGTPVSMSQSIAAGVVGVAASEGGLRVRWQNVVDILAAWGFTLPSALGMGFLVGAIVQGMERVAL